MSTRAATCPNCGATIEFLWAGAIQTTCPACRSILVRHDLDLEKVGEVGQVPPTTTAIRIGTEGQYKGTPFVVVGRIIYEHERGHWNEWHLRMADDSSAWLGDAMLEYTVTRRADDPAEIPAEDDLRIGDSLSFGGTKYQVASITTAHYAGVEGELPFEYWDKSAMTFVDLRAKSDHFATIDYSESPPLLFTGEYETFDQLKLSNLREPEEIAGIAGKVQGFNCPSCGAAIELQTGDLTRTVSCVACASIIDAKDPNYRVIERFDRKALVKPLIPLGTEGMLDGHGWRAIGFQVRSITVDEVQYAWREYLLWNSYRGFRYLTEYDGHWNDVRTVHSFPREVSSGTQPVLEHAGTRFKHFQSAVATTRFILGEFPWEVRRGDTNAVADYVAPPLMLSREDTDLESTWSLGTYTPAERIWKAFKLPGSPPRATGVYANQPNPHAGIGKAYAKIFGVMLLALIGLLVVRLATAQRKLVYEDAFQFNRATRDTGAFVTPVFALDGRTANVEIAIGTSLMNSWGFFDMALIENATGQTYEVGRDVAKYAGVEDGEAWQEGSSNDRVVIGSVPSGQYYLRVRPEVDPARAQMSYTVSVYRDVVRVSYYLVAILLLTVPFVFALLLQHSFESKRWMESDHAPTSSEDDDE